MQHLALAPYHIWNGSDLAEVSRESLKCVVRLFNSEWGFGRVKVSDYCYERAYEQNGID